MLGFVCWHCAGVELIAEGLAHNSCLLRLDLSNNLISNAGAIELAEALHSTKCKVADLLLSNNRIGM
jgi:Ran GTPase-activating protein (RanGAP) involved in mRNA processing and transport